MKINFKRKQEITFQLLTLDLITRHQICLLVIQEKVSVRLQTFFRRKEIT